jgi:hypothetical protein
VIQASEEDFQELLEVHPVIKFYQEQIAHILENRSGTEGEVSRSEGGISRTYTDNLIPTEIKVALLKFSKQKAVRF